MIGQQKNYDDTFLRMVSASLVKTMSRCIHWINYFEESKIRVVVPFYMSMGGDERFVLDAFVDDITNSRIELNTDQIPRGIITFIGFNTDINEFANPNQYISKKSVINGQMKSFLQKVKGIPVKLNYDISILLMSEIDVMKCSEKILHMLFNYMYFNFDYFGIKINAVFSLPDDKQIEILREQNLDTEHKKYIKFSIVVNTYYPSFYEDVDDYIIADNDNDINWTRMCKTRPSLKDPNDLSKVRAVYWKSYLWDISKTPTDTELNDRSDTPKENF